MEKEVLMQIPANQVLIFKRIEDLEYAVKEKGFRSAPLTDYHREMVRETSRLIDKLKNPNV